MDEHMRSQSQDYADTGINHKLVSELRAAVAGRLDDAVLAELFEGPMDYFRTKRLHDLTHCTMEWRRQARLFALAELEALKRMSERDDGDYNGKASLPELTQDLSSPDPEQEAPAVVSIKGLFQDYLVMKKQVGRVREVERRWTPVFRDLIAFIGHDDYNKVTKQDFMRWRDSKLENLKPATVKKVYLSAVRTVLNYALENDKISENKIANVKQRVARNTKLREQGFTQAEAQEIVIASIAYQPAQSEKKSRTAAKKWIPLLLAFSGARVNELTQLRRHDVRQEGDVYVIRISPAAGTVKADQYRDVPIHTQIIELGFIDFLRTVEEGPLFYIAVADEKAALERAQTTGVRITQWLHQLKLIPPGLQPNHAWRHRFKTIGREAGISDVVIDAITGHAHLTAGDQYGDVTLKTKVQAIAKLPRFVV